MNSIPKLLLTFGILFLGGLSMDYLGRKTKLPRVTLLLLLGFAIGPSAFNLLPHSVNQLFPLVTDIALAIIGFLIGGKLTVKALKGHSIAVLSISISEVLITALIVAVGLILIGVQIDTALLLAAISAATDPAATVDVISETRSDGPFTRTLLGIVAIDDAWTLILFSVLFAVVQAQFGQGFSHEILLASAWEIFGALLLGIVLGIPMAYLTGRIKSGEPTMVEALGLVFICCGIALWLKVSFLLASMTLGCVVTNLAKHHNRPFHAIENIELPFMIMFFILAGVSLHLNKLIALGIIGLGYVIFRVFGRFIGAWLGAKLASANPIIRRWMGLALMPQAGVALGMALIINENMPKVGAIILPIVLCTTVIFEITGPIITRVALIKTNETGKLPQNS